MTKHQQESTRSQLVWYASYGSNLNRKRFMCYILGGSPPGSSTVNPGCRDKTAPLDSKPINLNLELYFADYSSGWKGAPAFVRAGRADASTLGRMYLISDEQFNDVVLQENGRSVDGTRFVPKFEELIISQEFILPGRPRYGRVIHVGRQGEYPVFTFTAIEDLHIGAPSKAYINVIVSGIRETYPAMTNADIVDYLSKAEGIRDGAIPNSQLASWVEAAV